MVSFKGVTVFIGKKEILKDISFSLPVDGNIIGLFGPNGAGKTTLLRTLVGLISTYTGDVIVTDAKKVAFLPDGPYLYSFLKITDCIELFATRYEDFNTDKAIRIFDELGLSRTQKISASSKGMLEQIHLALTISRDASLYVLDEPLAAVDPLTRDLLMDMIINYRNPRGTVIISTHLINGVERLFDEVIMIHGGKLMLHDSAEALKSSYEMSLEDIFKVKMRAV